jgi:heptose-I-phosphate ethanolaminephosphotransferase
MFNKLNADFFKNILKNIISFFKIYYCQIILGLLAISIELVFWKIGIEINDWYSASDFIRTFPLFFFLLGICCFHKKTGIILSSIISCLYLIYLCAQIWCGIYQKMNLCRLQYCLILDTNFFEITDFFKAYPLTIICVLVLILFICIIAFLHYLAFKKKVSNWHIIQVIGILLIMPWTLWSAHGYLKHNSINVQLSYPFALAELQAVLYGETIMNSFVSRIQKEQIMPENINVKSKTVNGIVLLGESATRKHMNIYGYNRETTPFMSKRSTEWIAYDKVLSPASITYISCAYMFSNDLLNKNADNFLLIPSFFHDLGDSSVTYITSQYCKGGFDSVLIKIFDKSNQFIINNKNDDIILFDKFKECLYGDDKSSKRIFIMHFLGSHFPFQGKCPKELSIFSKEDPSKINYYDDSILYTDYCIEQYIKEIENLPSPTWCIYVSDHGETPESYNRNIKMEECWEIPLLFYFNKAYKDEFPELVAKVNEAKHISFQTDVFFEIICDLMGVTWEKFPYENIPYHPSFKSHEFIFPK